MGLIKECMGLVYFMTNLSEIPTTDLIKIALNYFICPLLLTYLFIMLTF